MTELFAAFGINWKLLLIQALNFGILLVILWKYLYTPVLKIIEDRKKKIEEGVQNADEAARKLAASDGEGKEIVLQAARKAEELVAEARTRADEKRQQMIVAAEERAEAILADASARAEEAKRQALLSSEREIARTAMLAAEKILRQKSA
ncbi:F0F1 ATP synthase subunit B [Candidatus Kaiserbacteria bacterium]|nr:F0F1 ATP synthase subunit B [Candidatus Kaiserbacteria bacterium]